MRTAHQLGILALLLLGLSACADSTDDQAARPRLQPSGPLNRAEATPEPPASASPYPTGAAARGRATPRELPERVPTGSPVVVVGEVPRELLDRIMEDLRGQLKIDDARFEVLRAEAIVWNDGSLGCPEPGQFYTQALVEGYWVVLGWQEERFDYRANRDGYFFLCTRPPSRDSGIVPDK